MDLEDVNNWYLNDSYNTIINDYNGVKISNNYRFGCIIPQQIIDLLMLKQSAKQIYLGSNLSVLEEINGDIRYNLYFYTYIYNEDTKKYLIGRVLYEIIYYSIDYLNYINSKTYIRLDITPKNIDFSKVINVQGIKQGKFLCSTRLDIDNEQKVNFSLLDIYTNKTRKRYGVSNALDTNFLYNTPIFIYNYLSRTPSTCIFSCDLLKKLKKINSQSKRSIFETKLPYN